MTRFHFEFILFRCRKKRCGLVNSKYVVFNIRHSINKNPDMFQKNKKNKTLYAASINHHFRCIRTSLGRVLTCSDVTSNLKTFIYPYVRENVPKTLELSPYICIQPGRRYVGTMYNENVEKKRIT